MSGHPYGVLGDLEVPLALGLLRLSTEGRPDTENAIRVIHHALDQGIRVLDTADSYGLDHKDLHYGEDLVRQALERWDGPVDQVRVITKAGLDRPKGRWMPNARPAHLREAVDLSLQALGVEQIFLFLLHVNDPGCPFEDSLTTLAELQQAGKIAHLGLCNVGIGEIRQAQRHFEVCAIQNELSVMNRKSAAEGTLELARQLGIPFLAHRPLGGHAKVDNLLKNRAMKPIATRHQITPHQAALACLLDRGPPLLPLIGATRVESVDASLGALSVRLDDADREGLASKISFDPGDAALADLQPIPVPELARPMNPGDGPGGDAEVVMVMGVQGAGKSSLVQAYEDAGYARLNRDLIGGKLDDLVPMLEDLLAQGRTRVVLDNTYATRLSRRPVIRAAHRAAVPVRCHYLATPVREALINIVMRVLDRYDRLLGPDDLKELAKSDPNLPPPAALARFAAQLETPMVDEGFALVEEVPFERRPAPELSGKAKALLLDVDGTLRQTRSGEIYPTDPDDIEVLPGRRERLQQWLDDGWQLFFVSNQSGVASGKLSAEQAEACFERTIELLGLPVTDAAYCPHPAFPANCFCRKPMPGMGIALARKHGLDPTQWVMVGDMPSDQAFAEAIGATYHDAHRFFSD